MKVYLDNCSLQRPLDDKEQLRIVLEAEAILGVITLSQQASVELVLQRDLSTIASERHSHVTLSAAKGLDEAVGTDASLRSA